MNSATSIPRSPGLPVPAFATASAFGAPLGSLRSVSGGNVSLR